MKRMLVIVAIAIVPLVVLPAVALTPTTTRGNVCGSSIGCGYMETFSGSYRFRGRTTPSLEGQIVRLRYRTVGEDRWYRFGDPGSKRAFIAKGGSFVRIGKGGRWNKEIFLNDYAGHPQTKWRMRARFRKQDGYARSEVVVRVRVGYGD